MSEMHRIGVFLILCEFLRPENKPITLILTLKVTKNYFGEHQNNLSSQLPGESANSRLSNWVKCLLLRDSIAVANGWTVSAMVFWFS